MRALSSEMGLRQDEDFDVIEPGLELEVIDAARGDRARVREEFAIPDEGRLGITVARLVPIKNLFMLIRGVAAAVAAGSDWHWLLIGDGPQSTDLRREAAKLGVADRIHFLGFRESAEVHQFLSAADCFALTSSYENFSNSVLEALAHRLPVVMTDVGYLGTLARQSQGALLVPSDDAAGLALALERLSADSVLSRHLGDQGRKFVEQLDWPVIASKLLATYEKARGQGRTPQQLPSDLEVRRT